MPKIKTLALGALVFAAALFSYSNSLRNGFCWDDHILIEGNPFLSETSNLKILVEQIVLRPTVPIIGAARPVFLLSLIADYRLWGVNPRGYHLTNVALHGVNALLVWRAGLLFLQPDVALASGLLFAVHPINTEAVDLASFRPDILAALFMLLALLAWREMGSADKLVHAAAWAAGAALAYGLGIFSKETALVFPAAALWFDFCFLKKPWKTSLKRRLALMAVFCGMALYYWHFRSPRSGYASLAPITSAPAAASSFAKSAPPTRTLPIQPPSERVFNPSLPQWEALYHSHALNFRTMSVVFGDYLRLMVFPYRLRADRAPTLIFSWTNPGLWAAWALFLILLFAAAHSYALGDRAFCWALGWCALVLLPVSDAVHLYNPIAERYLYIADIGACWILAWAISRSSSALCRWVRIKPPINAALASCVFLIPFGALTRVRNRDWKSDAVLFGREAALGTKNARVYYNLGSLKQEQGDWSAAEQDYKTAIALNPNYVEVLNNLAGLQELQGAQKNALSLYAKAVDLKPGNSVPYDSLAAAWERQNNDADALKAYQKALQEAPDDIPARLGLAKILKKEGRDVEAFAQLEDAARRAPKSFEPAYQLASLLEALGRRQDAAGAWLSFLALEPKNARAMMDLGVVYDHAGDSRALEWLKRSIATDPSDAAAYYNLGAAENHFGHPDEAEKYLKSALVISPNYLDAAYNLAVVEQELGKTAAAIDAYKKVLALNPNKLEALNNLGGLYQMQGDLASAKKYLSLALSIAPYHPSLLNNIGNVYLQEGDLPEAIKAYRSAISMSAGSANPRNLAPTWANLGVCYYRQGDIEDAEKAWREALRDSPSYGPAQQWLTRAQREQGQ